MKTATKSNVLEAYALAWAMKQSAEDILKENRADMELLLKGAGGSVEYTFENETTVTFKAIDGGTVEAADLDTAREITGFGDARLLQIAGKVDAKKVKAFGELGKLTDAQVAKLLPVKPYVQIRGFRKG